MNMGNYLKQEVVETILSMAQEGMTLRQIEQATGVSKVTIGRHVLRVRRPDTVSTSTQLQHARKRKLHFIDCGYCGLSFLDKGGEKTSDLKHGRIKRAFCTHHCAMNYRSKQRHNDTCKRCGKTRKELAHWCFGNSDYEATGVCFTKGHCPKCYGLLQQFNFNDELATAHELNQQLKGELRDDVERKKHRRLEEDASGGHRGSSQGQGRSPAGPSDKRTQLTHFAIRPTRL
jgi:hypothetical protein